ncbi:DUF5132 domain-containing protein [Chlorogloeopsis sp. ULAP01]|uniref:DUF5132 domain-containing protein n=1 Tax=Chlorogloeopsis sp. ULAP01 TaxID=3056483 RepID=UPI0025AB0AAD|nr:DUF5132 domain-containing protein [Chlorogloeopsis sp. ULAP01]MDM9384980.1 DUF5132 domain-containing protein [Chlorogloeopsis sp. ULAP01]
MAPKIVDFVEDAGAPGVIAGVGAVILAPVLLPVFAGIGRPIAKSVVKGGIVFYEKSRGALAGVGETWEDLVAEVKAELAESNSTVTMDSTEETRNQSVSASTPKEETCNQSAPTC